CKRYAHGGKGAGGRPGRCTARGTATGAGAHVGFRWQLTARDQGVDQRGVERPQGRAGLRKQKLRYRLDYRIVRGAVAGQVEREVCGQLVCSEEDTFGEIVRAVV